MNSGRYKRRYHPMIILMFHSGILSPDEIKLIPRTTRNEWSRFKHENYFGYAIAKDYIEDFDYMKDVLVSKHLRQGMKFMCAMSYGYKNIMSEIEKSKKMVLDSREKITFSIKQLARYGNLNLTDACRYFGVSKDWFYRHRNKQHCVRSRIRKCYKKHPNQLTMDEVSTIERVLSTQDNIGKPKTTIYYDSIRKGIISCGISTFFKYANLLGFTKRTKQKPHKQKKGFNTTRPFEWLHIDVTHIQTQKDGLQYVAFIKDNYSKALLGYKSISHRPDSNFIRELFEETFFKYDLLNTDKPINILSDGGSENKGSFLEWINQIDAPPKVSKLTAKTDEFPYSNSMAESTHSIYKTEFMNKKHSFDVVQHIKDLERFMIYYNNERFPSLHFGLTPLEVLNGEQPDKHRFREAIKKSQKLRIEKNKAFNKCPVLCL